MTTTITNEMLYELIKEFKEDFKYFKTDVLNRFEQVDKRFEQVDDRFEQMDKRLIRIEDQQIEDRKLLMQLWENRSKSNLNFTSFYFLITLFASTTVAMLGSYVLISLIR